MEIPWLKKVERTDPCYPVEVWSHHATAVQALIQGNCPDHLQRDFIKWLIEDVCATYDLSYRPHSDRDTAFAEGKRFVGSTIVKASKLDPKQLKSLKEEHVR